MSGATYWRHTSWCGGGQNTGFGADFGPTTVGGAASVVDDGLLLLCRCRRLVGVLAAQPRETRKSTA